MNGAGTLLASVDSTGITGYGNKTSTSFQFLIDNTAYSYYVYAWGNPAWDCNMKIMGAVITYAVSEAP